MASELQRAWQRALKNGKTEMYAAVPGRVSVRVVGEKEDCVRIIESFEEITGAAIHFDPPAPLPGQLDIYGGQAA